MNWYYAHDSQQTGPVSDSDLDALLARGAITPSTLVWREGMTDWQPLSMVRQPAAGSVPPIVPAIAPPVFGRVECAECRRAFSKDEVLRYENVFVCADCKPTFFQKVREGVATGSLSELWRSGNLLVLRKDAFLPDRCVKCNQPANGFKLPRKLSWHTPWLYLLILPSLLIYIIVALIVSKKARLEIGLCQEHRQRRRRDLAIAWLIFVLSLVAFGAAAALSNGWLALAGVSLLLVAIVYGAVRVPPVQAKRIDNQFLWLKGVSPAFLATLPEFRGH